MARDIVRIAIHPAIGIARVGNSTTEFFHGPELPDERPARPGFYRDAQGAIKRHTGLRAGQAVDARLRGNREALRDYTAQLRRIRAVYVRHHDDAYLAERRWPAHPFWRRRHARNDRYAGEEGRLDGTREKAREKSGQG
ncbi:hypothetical protein HUT19_36555 [Streptomyces sp. NA02950]|uniref:LodA/GoxA family CTQ-dependent oxidase n=1 Tax=Streptomyces sp. NA02950 TaxID=2742137 RepID=UPI0015910E60|nr:LodA/GoxA family CTQ-dependent oxidase [Streptomyces sp. NA02950]QKV96531.1 hypothetical protein HUT19_36555 [Streptomyces sp. NA02950]